MLNKKLNTEAETTNHGGSEDENTRLPFLLLFTRYLITPSVGKCVVKLAHRSCLAKLALASNWNGIYELSCLSLEFSFYILFLPCIKSGNSTYMSDKTSPINILFTWHFLENLLLVFQSLHKSHLLSYLNSNDFVFIFACAET